MFGYITINKPELKVREYNRYRAFYCGLCRELKSRHGVFGELTLTYDMTFLVMLLAGLYEPAEEMTHGSCLLHPAAKRPRIRSEATAYGADMNILLAYYKELDDWKDEGSLKGRAASCLLHRHAVQIAASYPRQAQAIRKELSILHRVEESGTNDPERASRAFGRLLGEIFIWKEDAWKQTLYRIGYYLGMYIYLADAWDDREKDAASGSFNPLAAHPPTEQALRELLMQIMAHAAENFEYLPIVRDAEILRNILYAGVWTRLGHPVTSGCIRHDPSVAD